MQRLLIMTCSERKHDSSGLLPAIERYDGPAFNVLRRYLNSHPNDNLKIWVLSAAFGLIPALRPIPMYDTRMTKQRAAELREASLAIFSEIIRTCDTICLSLSKDYVSALQGYEALIPMGVNTTIIGGSQGIRLAQLKQWLWGGEVVSKPSLSQTSSRKKPQNSNCAVFKGIKVQLKPYEIIERIENELIHADQAAYHLKTWHVIINGQCLAPKWIVSRLTGVPVNQFTSGEARRLLTQLGIECYETHAG